jgi:hypothetical protein
VEPLYDTSRLLERAAEWRQKAELADQSDMRAFCLGEASRCEAIVRRSLEAPMFKDADIDQTTA